MRLKLLLLLVVLALVAGFIYLRSTSAPTPKEPEETSEQQSEEVATPPATITKVPERSQTFNVSGQFQGPEIRQITLNPFGIKEGGRQTVTVRVKDDNNPVTAVRIILKTDNKEVTHELSLTSGTVNDGSWSSSWVVDDTVETNYEIVMQAESATGRSESEIVVN